MKDLEKNDGACTTREQFEQVEYTVKYQPEEYMVVKELVGTDKKIDQTNYQQVSKKYQGLVYFMVKISSKEGEKSPLKAMIKTKDQQSKITQFMLTDFYKCFSLEVQGQKFEPVLFHAEDDHNLMNYNLVTMAFEVDRADLSKGFDLVYHDPFFNKGIIRFNYSKKTLSTIPKLKI